MAASKKPSRNMWVWRPNEHVSIFHGTYKVSLLYTTNYLNVTAKVIRSMDMPCTEIWLGIIFNFAQSAINVQQYYSIDDIWYQDILVKLKITILWTIRFKIVHLVPTETDAGNAGWKGIHNKSLKGIQFTVDGFHGGNDSRPHPLYKRCGTTFLINEVVREKKTEREVLVTCKHSSPWYLHFDEGLSLIDQPSS